MTHAELCALQALFHRAIVHPTGIDAFLAEADADTRAAFDAAFADTPAFDRRARMNVYADAYFWRLHGVLEDHFGLVAWLLGAARFRNLATDYVLARPSVDPDIRRFGARLPAFVAEHPEHARMPGLAELAAIEWAMVRALDVAQPAPRQRDTLAALPPEAWPTLRLHAMPSAALLPCAHDFTALWSAHADTPSPASPPSPTPAHHVLVWRHHHDVLHRPVDDAEAEALAHVIDGTAFVTLCEHHDAELVVAMLMRWIDAGLLRE
jgi:hypothetical protein